MARIQRGADFMVFYRASEQVAQGAPLYPDPGTPLTYMYPPPLALLLVPLTYVNALYDRTGLPAVLRDGNLAIFLFAVISLLGVAGTIILLSRFGQRTQTGLVVELGVIALAAWPVEFMLRQGQVDSLTLVLMVGSLLLAWRGRPHGAAFALGLAISIKVTPGVLVLYLLWKRKYRLALESLGVAAALLLGSGLVVGFESVATFFTRVLPRIGAEGQTYWYNQSLHAAFLRLFTTNEFTQPVADLGISVVVLATGLTASVLLALTLASVSRNWPTAAPVYLVEAGAFLLLEVLTSSLSWQMHAVWLLLPLGGLMLFAREERSAPRWLLAAVGVAALGFIAGPYEPPFEYGRFATGWATLLISHTVAADLLLLALCLYVSRAAGRYLAQRSEPAPA